MESVSNNILLLSIKPQFAEKILIGEKTIELRKSFPNKVNTGDYLLIYVTSPEKEVKGICVIDSIISKSPECLWHQVKNKIGISKLEYESYYQDCRIAHGIVLKDVEHFDKPIKLSELRRIFPNFNPPQTYCYFNIDDFQNSELEYALNIPEYSY